MRSRNYVIAKAQLFFSIRIVLLRFECTSGLKAALLGWRLRRD